MASIESNKPVNTIGFPPTDWDSAMSNDYPSHQQKYINVSTQYGWECPRCGKINAPWTNQCTCHRQQTYTYSITTAGDYPKYDTITTSDISHAYSCNATYTIHNGETKA